MDTLQDKNMDINKVLSSINLYAKGGLEEVNGDTVSVSDAMDGSERKIYENEDAYTNNVPRSMDYGTHNGSGDTKNK